jgi:hypothetical protein
MVLPSIGGASKPQRPQAITWTAITIASSPRTDRRIPDQNPVPGPGETLIGMMAIAMVGSLGLITLDAIGIGGLTPRGRCRSGRSAR